MRFFNKGRIKLLLLNIVTAIVLLIAIGVIVFKSLEAYTNHGFYLIVPELRGLTPNEAEKFVDNQKLKTVIIDSIYDENTKPGTIVEQFPSSGTRVKNNKNIQLTINAVSPEKIIFPNLRNTAYRQTMQRLQNLGLYVERVQYAPSNFKNLVIDFKRNGVSIPNESVVQKGDSITIVLGDGNNPESQVYVPSLLGMEVTEARKSALSAYMNVGEIIPDNTINSKLDWNTATIVKQEPENSEMAKMGSDIKVYITRDKQKLSALDTLIIDTQE